MANTKLIDRSKYDLKIQIMDLINQAEEVIIKRNTDEVGYENGYKTFKPGDEIVICIKLPADKG